MLRRPGPSTSATLTTSPSASTDRRFWPRTLRVFERPACGGQTRPKTTNRRAGRVNGAVETFSTTTEPRQPGGPVEILKVSSRSNPNSVAGAMAGVVRQTGAVEVQVVGAGALNQAVKAIAIARGYLTPSNVDLVCVPTFADIEIDGESRTAIRLSVEDRTHRLPSSEGATAAKDGKTATDGSLEPAHASI